MSTSQPSESNSVNNPAPLKRSVIDVKRVPPPPVSAPLPRWIDYVVLLVALIIAGVSIAYTVQVGAFNISLLNDPLWSWHLIRACGTVAYGLLTGSMLWGIFLSSRVIKNWSPGVLSLLLHAATSWLAIVFSLLHILLLLIDSYFHYTLPDILLPFVGPYRPIPTGLGVIGFYLIAAVTLSFTLRRLFSSRAWHLIHYTSYAAFALITVHVLLAGTDAIQPGLRIILATFGIVVGVLLMVRVGQAAQNRQVRAASK